MRFEISKEENRGKVKSLVISLRPLQWVKNLFILAALVFSQNLFNPSAIFRSLLAFLAFCLISSAVYLFNDIADLSNDRQHPLKKKRPLAAGQISSSAAATTLLVLTFLGLTLSALINYSVLLIITLYLFINISYSLCLKRIPFIDLFIIALGFVLRAVAGAEAISVYISPWLLVCAFLLALLLATGKRLLEQPQDERSAVFNFSLKILFLVISLITIVIYSGYTINPEAEIRLQTSWLWFSVIFVTGAIFRYSFLVLSTKSNPQLAEYPLKDKIILLLSLFWIFSIFLIIYAKP